VPPVPGRCFHAVDTPDDASGNGGLLWYRPRVFETRIATADDFEAWYELFSAVAEEGKWIGREAPIDRSVAREGFESYLDSNRRIHILAESDESQLVGELAIQADRTVADFGMMVASGWRGRGVGSALLRRAIDWATDHDCPKVALQVWPHNTTAIALYRKFGFEEEGRLRRHYRRRNGELWDAIVMGLVLDNDSPGSPYEPG
jgi:RimJ/RimL family protein N-acetyltransferase